MAALSFHPAAAMAVAGMRVCPAQVQPVDEAELPHAFLNASLHSHSSPQPGLVAAYGQISVQTSDSDRFLSSNMTDPPQITPLLPAHTNCGVLCLTPQLSVVGAG